MQALVRAVFPGILLALGLTSCGNRSITFEEGLERLDSLSESYSASSFNPPSEYSLRGHDGSLSVFLDVNFEMDYRRERYESADGLYFETFLYLDVDEELGYCVVEAVQANTEDFETKIESYRTYSVANAEDADPLYEGLYGEFSDRVLEVPGKLRENLSEEGTSFYSDGGWHLKVDCGASIYEFSSPMAATVPLLSSYSVPEEDGEFTYGNAELSYPVFDATWTRL